MTQCTISAASRGTVSQEWWEASTFRKYIYPATRTMLSDASTSGDETIDAYSQAAARVQQAETPSQIRGGQLLDDAQIASLTSSGAISSASAS